MPDFLIAGAGGMLGSSFASRNPDAIAVGRTLLDPRRIQSIHDLIVRSQVRCVINCAAHTDVDLAEKAPADAWRANAILPGILAAACRATGATLVQFSSTGVYGDWKQDPYEEDDDLRPTTVHHRTKAAGEMAVRESGCEHLIIRTGWLFGGRPGQPKNFVWKRLLEALNSRELTCDATQVGNPTAVSDVVEQTLATLNSGYRGTINLVSQGSATRLAYIRRIVDEAGLPCLVVPSDKDFARVARVSKNEAAVNWRLKLLGLDRMPTWEAAVDAYLATLKMSPEWDELRAGA